MGQVLVAVGGFLAAYGGAILTVASIATSIALSLIPKPPIESEGPRLGENRITTSTYGRAIPRLWARMRVGGNIVWATEIEEEKNVKKSGGKGGMFGGSPEQKYTEWRYYGNFAIGLAFGDGGGAIARIYANSKLIYDATGVSGTFNKYPDCGIRVYQGGAAQRVDPLIEADKGAGNSPAYRGLMMVVFEHLPLLDFGNRLPMIEVEADSEAAAQGVLEGVIGWTPSAHPLGAIEIKHQPTSRQMYLCCHGYLTNPGWIARVDMEENKLKKYIYSVGNAPYGGDPYFFDDYLPDYGTPPGWGMDVKVWLPYEDGKLFAAGTVEYGGAVIRVKPRSLEGTFSYDLYSYSGPPSYPTSAHGALQPNRCFSFTRKHLTGKIHNYSFLWCNGGDYHWPTALFNSKLILYDRDEEWFPGSCTINFGAQGGQPATRPAHAAHGEFYAMNGFAVDRDGIVWGSGHDPEEQWQESQSQTFGYVNRNTGYFGESYRIEVNRTQDITLYGITIFNETAKVEYKKFDFTDTLHNPFPIYDPSSHSLIMIGGSHFTPVAESGIGITIGTNTLTRSGGLEDFLQEGFHPGREITIENSASNDGTYTIDDVTATVITVEEVLTPEAIQYDLVLTQDKAYYGDYKWAKWDIETRTFVWVQTYNRYTDPGRDIYPSGVCLFTLTQWGTNNGIFYAPNANLDPGNTEPKVHKYYATDMSYEEVGQPTDLDPDWDQNYFAWERSGNQVWFVKHQGSPGDTYFERLQYDRVGLVPIALTDLLKDLVDATADLDSATDLDVTDTGLVGLDVRGYLVGRRMRVRAGIHPLAVPYQFDMVESEDVLKVVARGGASARTIQEADLGAKAIRGAEASDAEQLVIDRSQEHEVPYRFDLTYIDPARDYQEGNQADQRHTIPNPSMYGRDVAQLQIALVLTADEARQAAEKALTQAWVQRTGYELSLGPKHMDLEPTDVVTVVKNGVAHVMRISKQEIGESFVSRMRAASDDAEVYTSSITGVSALSPVQSIGLPGGTVLFILDIPLLRDEDDGRGLSSGAYVGFAPYLPAWRGAVAEVSVDGGSSWERFSSSRGDSPWGSLMEAVPALSYDAYDSWPYQVNTIDEETTITVDMVQGDDELSSMSREELFWRQANVMVIGTGANAEVIKYANVTDNGDGTFTFDTLLRGRRGTEEAAMAGHAQAEDVLFISEEDTNRVGIDLGHIGVARLYRATSTGEYTDTAAVISHEHEGNDLKPYSGCDPEASPPYTGSARTGNVTVTWTRRTRVGGLLDLADGVLASDVYTGEDIEEYDVVLLAKTDADSDVWKTGITDPSVGATFTNAEITTAVTGAGYSNTDRFNFEIYQKSSVVGRGLPRSTSI